jgi:hypothetical protein
MALRIREATTEEMRYAWAKKLAALRDQDPLHLAQSYIEGFYSTARRMGLVAGPVLHEVFRLMNRIDPNVPSPRVVSCIDDLDNYIAQSPILQELLLFATSQKFGKALKQCEHTYARPMQLKNAAPAGNKDSGQPS